MEFSPDLFQKIIRKAQSQNRSRGLSARKVCLKLALHSWMRQTVKPVGAELVMDQKSFFIRKIRLLQKQ